MARNRLTEAKTHLLGRTLELFLGSGAVEENRRQKFQPTDWEHR